MENLGGAEEASRAKREGPKDASDVENCRTAYTVRGTGQYEQQGKSAAALLGRVTFGLTALIGARRLAAQVKIGDGGGAYVYRL